MSQSRLFLKISSETEIHLINPVQQTCS